MSKVVFPHDNSCLKKWRVKEGSSVIEGSVLCDFYKERNCKLKCKFSGTVSKLLVKEGDTINSGDVVAVIEECQHQTRLKNMCADCGAYLFSEQIAQSSANTHFYAMEHSIPDLLVSEKTALSLGKNDEKRLLEGKRLVLLVDLDHTLIHTTTNNVYEKDLFHFQLPNNLGQPQWYHTKFRPGTRHFLTLLSQHFEMHIYTFGVRAYAHAIAKYMDPHRKFFQHRILSRNECFHPALKTLNLKSLFPCGDQMVVIVDDREDVWQWAPNLIRVKPFIHFEGFGDVNAPSRKGSGGGGGDGSGGSGGGDVCGGGGEDEGGGDGVDLKGKSSESGKSRKRKRVTFEGDDEVRSKSSKKGVAAAAAEDTSNDTSKCEEASLDEVKGKIEEEEKAVKENNEKEEKDSTREGKEEKKGDDENEKLKNEGGRERVVAEGSGGRDVNEGVQDGRKIEDGSKNEMKEEEKEDEMRKEEKGEEMKEEDKKEEKEDEMKKEEKEEEMKEEEKEDEMKKEEKEKVHIDLFDRNSNDSSKDENHIQNKNADETRKVKNTENIAKKNTKTGTNKNTETGTNMTYKPADDYLTQLENILMRVHGIFYSVTDPLLRGMDVKRIIPEERAKVLQGCKLVFSGVVPLKAPRNSLWIHHLAASHGGVVMEAVVKGETTHVVGVRNGTEKIKKALKIDGVKVVNFDWLVASVEEWKRQDESKYPIEQASKWFAWYRDNLMSRGVGRGAFLGGIGVQSVAHKGGKDGNKWKEARPASNGFGYNKEVEGVKGKREDEEEEEEEDVIEDIRDDNSSDDDAWLKDMKEDFEETEKEWGDLENDEEVDDDEAMEKDEDYEDEEDKEIDYNDDEDDTENEAKTLKSDEAAGNDEQINEENSNSSSSSNSRSSSSDGEELDDMAKLIEQKFSHQH